MVDSLIIDLPSRQINYINKKANRNEIEIVTIPVGNQVENTRYQGGSYTARGSSSNSNRNGNGAASSSSKYGGSYSSTDSGYNRATIGGGSTTFEEGSYFDRYIQFFLGASKNKTPLISAVFWVNVI